jgi:hypothetical protein
VEIKKKMKIKRIFIYLLILVFLSACGESKIDTARKNLVGSWRGEGTFTFLADGKFAYTWIVDDEVIHQFAGDYIINKDGDRLGIAVIVVKKGDKDFLIKKFEGNYPISNPIVINGIEYNKLKE